MSTTTRRDRSNGLTEDAALCVVWRGSIQFEPGGRAKWLLKIPPYREDSVQAILNRLAAHVTEGFRWLDVQMKKADHVKISGWDWRSDWEQLESTLADTLQAAAPLKPKGQVDVFVRDHNELRRISYTFVGKRLDIEDDADGDDDGDDGDDGIDTISLQKKMAAAHRAIGPAFMNWLDSHPRTKLHYKHSRAYGYIDRLGTEIINPLFQRTYPVNEGIGIIQDKRGYRLLDTTSGTSTSRLKPSRARYVFADTFIRGLAPVAVSADTFGYVDRTGTLQIPAVYLRAEPFHGPLAIVRVPKGIAPKRLARCFHPYEQRWITTAGELVGDPFDYTLGFTEDVAWVFRHDLGSYGCINPLGDAAFAKRFASVGVYAQGLAAVSELTGGELRELGAPLKFGYADVYGNMVIPAQFDEAHPFSEGRAVVRKLLEYHMIDRKGQVLGQPFNGVVASMSEGMLAVRIKNKIGFLNRNGECVVRPKYEEAYGYFEGLAYVSLKAKHGEPLWGHIDRDGHVVIQPTLQWTNRFVDGLAPAKMDGLFGYINREGVWIVPSRYLAIQPQFRDGLAWIQLP